MTTSYSVYLEMVAVESVDGNVIDPEKPVPFSVLWETRGTLGRVINAECGS